MADLISRLRELLTEATPGPWRTGTPWVSPHPRKHNEKDLELIVLLRNHAEVLADIVTSARGLDGYHRTSSDGRTAIVLDEPLRALGAALSRLEEAE